MAVRQVANLRASTTLTFGDADQANAYELELARARAVQRCAYAIAPRQSFRLASGRILNAGDEIKAEHFEHSVQAGPGWRQLEALVARGVVIESNRWPSGPEAA